GERQHPRLRRQRDRADKESRDRGGASRPDRAAGRVRVHRGGGGELGRAAGDRRGPALLLVREHLCTAQPVRLERLKPPATRKEPGSTRLLHAPWVTPVVTSGAA